MKEKILNFIKMIALFSILLSLVEGLHMQVEVFAHTSGSTSTASTDEINNSLSISSSTQQPQSESSSSLDGTVLVEDSETIVSDSSAAATDTDVSLSPADSTELPILIFLHWSDSGNQINRPAEVTLTLLRDGEAIRTQTFTTNASGYFQALTFDGLYPIFNNNGNVHTYTVQIQNISKYVSRVSTLTLYTNSFEGTISSVFITDIHTLYIYKSFQYKTTVPTQAIDSSSQYAIDEDLIPDEITFYLLQNGIVINEFILGKHNNWRTSFADMPSYDENNNLYDYTIQEAAIEGFLTEVAKSHFPGATYFNITNYYSTNITATKLWQGGPKDRPSVTLQLYQQLVWEDESEPPIPHGPPVTLSNGQTEYTWENLHRGYNEYTIYKYTVKEVDVPEGYTASYADDGLTVTNTYDDNLTHIEGAKTWDDGGNQTGKRPSSITVNLLADGNKIDSTVVTENENWQYRFIGLPKYSDSEEIVYTITEDPVENYSATILGYNITNKYNAEKTSVTVTKRWNDNDNKAKQRPESIVCS